MVSLKRIKELLKEASTIGVTNFSLSGGDLFVYKYWKEVLAEILVNGFQTYISTKYPLKKEDVEYLKQLGIESMQISYDTDDALIQQKLLNVGIDYKEKMLETFAFFEKANMKLHVKSVLTKYNSGISAIDNLLNRLMSYKNIIHISIAPSESSLYKNFEHYRVDRTVLENALAYVEQYKKKNKITKIDCQGYIKEEEFCSSFEEKEKNYSYRAQCTANVTSLYILPDGKVGICEELYWHPDFIVGDVNKQSLMEVWNSEKAKNLFNIQQKDFPKESVCASCQVFDNCRKKLGVCWKYILRAYGNDQIYEPDPRCPLAQFPEKCIFPEKTINSNYK